jgi:hypothetical protein
MMKKPKMPKAADDMKAGMPMPRFGARAMRPGGMAKGGKVHPDAAMDRKLIKEEIGKAHKKMGMKEGGAVKKMAAGGSASKRADGVATHGKTKGKFI